MQKRRQADVDHVDAVVRQYLFDRPGGGNPSARGDFPGTRIVAVTDHRNLEAVGQILIGVEVLATDAGPDNGNAPGHASAPATPVWPRCAASLSAMACAINPSSQTLKQCS